MLLEIGKGKCSKNMSAGREKMKQKAGYDIERGRKIFNQYINIYIYRLQTELTDPKAF